MIGGKPHCLSILITLFCCLHHFAIAQAPASALPRESPEEKQRRELLSALIKRCRATCAAHQPTDQVTRLLTKVSSGEVQLDNRNLRSLTTSVLTALDVPTSSQLLVFSGSASQGVKVNPHNPRAIYFNDEVYVGIVPGGLLEVIGVDPNFGGVLYTFRNVGTSLPPTTTGAEESGLVAVAVEPS
jgi:hypothetical protein